jgi:UDP-N-acetylglucosamine 2-epimerase (non-hydrolysing)
MVAFELVCLAEKPDWVVVVGDVNSTLACALVASKIGSRIAHVEAGLRSYDRSMPEEINRIVTDTLSDLLFTPCVDADVNLLREGISQEKIHRVGNIMIDTVIQHQERARRAGKMMLSKMKLFEQQFIYVTLHRPFNVDNPQILGHIEPVRQTIKLGVTYW